jgi:hypothetical protein
MTQLAILYPVFVQVLLTFVLLFRLGPARVAAIRRGEVKLKDVALGQDAWPDHIRQLGRSFENQFQLPVLFYALAALALATRLVDLSLVVMAWCFVASRIVHAFIHTSSNNVRHRFNAYLVGVIVLLAMWCWVAFRVTAAGQ